MALANLNQGALAPVVDECLIEELDWVGSIPADLNGMLVRNGPNPYDGRFSGSGVLDWWPEAAMLHGISFAQGQARTYQNRWLRTQNWALASGVDNPDAFHPTNPNVNVIHHAGTALALAEGGVPLAFDDQLRTLGLSKTHPGTVAGMTAHPKIDPVSGELISFRQSWMPPFLSYSVMDRAGHETHSVELELGSPSMMHDMAITQTASIFFDGGVSFDPRMLEQGFRLPIRWYPERQCRLGIVARHDAKVQWLGIEPCFIQHVVNAFDEPDGSVVVQVARYPWYFEFDDTTATFAENPLAQLWQYKINVQIGVVAEQQLDDACIELPRINEHYVGQKHRYCYAVEQPTGEEMRGVIKYDLLQGARQRYPIAAGDQNSEPVFVARPGASEEDDGWLLLCVYKQESHLSEVHILDARDITQPALARVRLPRRIPAGFHGAWLPAG